MIQMGKRYKCEECGTEALCTKAGEGQPICCEKGYGIHRAKSSPVFRLNHSNELQMLMQYKHCISLHGVAPLMMPERKSTVFVQAHGAGSKKIGISGSHTQVWLF